MKKLSFIIFMVFLMSWILIPFTNTNAQTVIYFEGFDGVTFTGDWSRSNTFITIVNNAASDCISPPPPEEDNLLAPNCNSFSSGSFSVNNISTIGISGLSISFCQRWSGSFLVPVTLEWSIDGTNWNSISTIITTSGGDWHLASFSLPPSTDNQSSLSIRWSYNTTVTFSCNGSNPNYRIDDFSITATSLPIVLAYFKSEIKNEDKIDLFWQTQSETNNSHFAIQHSTINREFKNIGEVDGAGDSYEKINYSFTHQNPASGTNYYRLKQVDFDGEYSFSKIISVDIEPDKNTIIYPTLVSDKMHIEWQEEIEGPISIYIFSQHGKLMDEFSASYFFDKFTIDMHDYPVGIYFIKIQDGKRIMTEKIIKK